MKKINIAIDGFSGCGKSSTAKEVAKVLSYKFIDTGAMYRAVTLCFINNNVDIKSEEAVAKVLGELSIDFRPNTESGKSETFLNEQNVEEEIRKMYVSQMVSPVSAIKSVRQAMVAQQQQMGKRRGVVMDGRDIASVVFPDAELKVFMKASDEARARRRQKELEEKGEVVSLEEIARNFRERDAQDTSRKESPLVQVPEAVVIDTSDLAFEEQVQKILNLARQKIAEQSAGNMEVTIDKNSGYCFGVEFAIQMAEDEMEDGKLYCLGDIVHNSMEVKRLNAKGLEVIDREQLENIRDSKVLIRAHGEPPETYELALRNNIELVDASCPVVLKLQNRVKLAHDKMNRANGQIVIYGKTGHAEVIGLTGQTNNEAVIVMNDEDLEKIDFNRPVTLFSQTTKSTSGFYRIREMIQERIKEAKGELEEIDFSANDSICRQVSNREPQLERFAEEQDVIIFVSGKKSSNGKALYGVCKRQNERSYFVENKEEVDLSWFKETDTIGICGATSTPMWLMENVASHIKNSFLKEAVG